MGRSEKAKEFEECRRSDCDEKEEGESWTWRVKVKLILTSTNTALEGIDSVAVPCYLINSHVEVNLYGKNYKCNVEVSRMWRKMH